MISRVLKKLLIALSLMLAIGPLAPLPASAAPPKARLLAKDVAGTGHEVDTGVVEAPAEFDVAGLAYEGPKGAKVELRASKDAQHWTQWFRTEDAEDEGPDPGSPERHSERRTLPLWTDSARYVQMRTTSPNGPVSRLRLRFVDAQGHTESLGAKVARHLSAPFNGAQGAGSQAAAAADRPPIVSRAQWRADESIRRNGPSYGTVKGAIVHHTETGNSYSPDQAASVVRGIYAYHVQSNGWSDIGYNFLVDRYGTIYEGRYGGVDRPVIGAQAMGFNSSTTGVAMLGSFMNEAPTQAMLDSTARLLSWRLGVAGVDPTSRVTHISGGSDKYAAGVAVTVDAIAGHRDVNYTDCPGNVGYGQLGRLRQMVAQLNAPASPPPPPPPPPSKPASRLAGGDRYGTAAAVAGRAFPATASDVIIASGDNAHLVDSLVAAPLATSKHAPLLLTAASSLPAATARELDRLRPANAWLVGGPASIDETLVAALGERGINVQRLSGPDAPATAAAVAAAIGNKPSGVLVVAAERDHLVDGLAASGPAAGLGRPVLLVHHDSVPPVTAQALNDLGANRVWVAGGPSAIDDGVVAALGATRLAGSDRWSTAATLAQAAIGDGLPSDTYVIASGEDSSLVDALAGSALGRPMLLTARASLPAPTRDFLQARKSSIASALVMGGAAAVSDDTTLAIGYAIS